ncbi:MAG: hypothetical protein RL235_114 [Chlamydiota bacterium]|jgi:small subunit ribosomal protein S16
MALIIRMRQQGANSRQRFRIVVADSRWPRDGKYVEKLGWYNPFGQDLNNYFVDVTRLQYWIGMGAQVSDRVKSLVAKCAPEVVKGISAKRVAKRDKERTLRKRRAAKKK